MNRNDKILCTVLLMLVLVSFLFSFSCYADTSDSFVPTTGLTVTPLSDEETQRYLSYMELTTVKQEYNKTALTCFDVSDSGLIAVGMSTGSQKMVFVYDGNGMFLYGYQFHDSGSFCLEWQGDYVGVYSVRGNTLVVLDEKGNCMCAYECGDSIADNDYLRNEIDVTERTVNGRTYVMKNDMGILNFLASSYSQIEITDADGTTRLVYDVNGDQITKTVFLLIAIPAFFGVLVYIVLYHIKEQAKKTKTAADPDTQPSNESPS